MIAGESHSLAPVVIVGGGISGLSAAWYLQQQGVPYILIEESQRWGGHILTERVLAEGGEYIVEAGPDSFITQKPWGVELARELGLEDRLLGTNEAMRRVYVLNKGKPTPMPDGVLLIVPTRLMPFVLSPLISPLGKLRMGLDLITPARRDGRDETLADFVRRRLGSEALDKIAEPLLSGIYNSEAERQSILATFPRFRDLEARYGSLTRGMLASRRESARRNGPGALSAGAKDGADGPRPLSTFMSLRDGTAELTEALVRRLTGALQLSTRVQQLERQPEGEYVLHTSQGIAIRASAVILAVPAFAAQVLIEEVAPQAVTWLAGIRYVSTGTVSLAFRTVDVLRPLAGFGLVVPSSEQRPINAITWSSLKFEGRAPAGYALLRVFFGGSRSPKSMELDDRALLTAVREQLRELMGIEVEPIFSRIYRWRLSNAQYDVGHLDRVAALEGALPDGLYLTGSPYRGVGLPDCIKQSRDTAARVTSRFRSDALARVGPG